MSYVCAACGALAPDDSGCPACGGPAFADGPAGLEQVRAYRELRQQRPDFGPGIIIGVGLIGLSYPVWGALAWALFPRHDNPFELARWPAVATGLISLGVAAWLAGRRTAAPERSLEARLGISALTWRTLATSPTGWVALVSLAMTTLLVWWPELPAVLGFRAADLRGDRPWTVLSGLFVHGGLSHVGWNCLFLLAVAPGVEPHISRRAYLLVFLTGGVAGHLGHAAVVGGALPIVGMSGAVMAIAGAHVVIDPGRKIVMTLYPGELPAVLALPLFAMLAALMSVLYHPGTAWAAHLGGFVAGGVLGAALKLTGHARPARLAVALD